MRRQISYGIIAVFCLLISMGMSAVAADSTVFTSDESYITDMDDMDGTGMIYKQDPYFTLTCEDKTPIDMYYAIYLDDNGDIEPFIHITTYKNGISSYDKLIIKTEKFRYTFNLSNMSPYLTDDETGLSLLLYLFDIHSMEMLRDLAESTEPVAFRLICSGITMNGTIEVKSKEDLIDFCDKYEAAGGENQNFFEKYSDAGNFLCDVTDLTKNEEAETEITPVEVSYSDKLVIAVVQQALTEAGFDSGKADGIIGSKTSSAISSYQSAMGLGVTGSINDELVEKLGVAEKVQKAARKEQSKKDYVSDITYEQLSRNPDIYNKAQVTFTGKVLQDIDQGNGKRGMRLAVNSDYDKVIYVFYDNDLVGYRILEDDQITVYGSSAGIYTYTSTMNQAISLPAINADILEIHY